MTESPSILTERVDDIALLVAQMRRMELPALIDSYFVARGNRVGLSLGWTATVWLAHLLSQADHRLNQVQLWVERRLETLRGSTGQPVTVLDLTDDRLGDLLLPGPKSRSWGRSCPPQLPLLFMTGGAAGTARLAYRRRIE
jgi:hypothetical protein